MDIMEKKFFSGGLTLDALVDSGVLITNIIMIPQKTPAFYK